MKLCFVLLVTLVALLGQAWSADEIPQAVPVAAVADTGAPASDVPTGGSDDLETDENRWGGWGGRRWGGGWGGGWGRGYGGWGGYGGYGGWGGYGGYGGGWGRGYGGWGGYYRRPYYGHYWG